MNLRGYLLSGLLAAALAAGGLVNSDPPIETPSKVHEAGLGPLQLERNFEEAKRAVFRSAPDSAFSGVGCAGLDEIRYDVELDGRLVGVMAMADNGRIREVEATLYSPSVSESREACLTLRDDFAGPFLERFGPFQQRWEVSKPVSQELLARTGPVVIAARWFSMGKSCYISAHYGVIDRGSLRLGESLAVLDKD